MFYRLTVKFETIYTHEITNKIEYTVNYKAAIRAFTVYMENPEVTFLTLDKIPTQDYDGIVKHMIAVYMPERA